MARGQASRTRAYFEPIGEKARWRVIYELLRRLDVGGILAYTAIGEALELDHVRERQKIAAAMRRAATELLHEDLRAVEAVPNVGYRIVEPAEQLRLARQYQRKAGRALDAGHSQVTHFDPTGLDPNMRAGFELLARAFAQQKDLNERFEKRGKEFRAALDSIENRAERTEDEVAEINARLARLERMAEAAE